MDPTSDLLTRGVANIIPSKDELEKVLHSDRKLNVYLGIDTTAPHLHLGHAVNLRKLKILVELGHHVTFLIGDFTTRVGDNSDKDSERPILTEAEIDANWQTYKSQAEKILDFSRVTLRRNSEWLAKLTFGDVLKLCQNFTLNDYISREIMKTKLAKGISVRLDEVLYPIMQGYDSWFMDTDIQIGAADQTFNMQAGRTLQKRLRNKESFILVNQYLTGTDGRKMSKSWGNAVWLDDSPNDMYGKVMSIKDELIDEYFLLATNISGPATSKPMDSKKTLAHQIVLELQGASAADSAQSYFERTIQNKEMPLERPVHHFDSPPTYIQALVQSGLAGSNSEARRLYEQKGVRFEGQVVTDYQKPMTSLGTISVGSTKFVDVKW